MAKQKKRRIKNPVAKNMNLFNRATVEPDKTKYNRQEKHKGSKDPYFLTKFSIICFLYNCISTIMLKCLVQYRGDSTGGAWWPLMLSDDIEFVNGQQYKIYGVIYSADTMPFRNAMYEACQEHVWNTLIETDTSMPAMVNRSNLS